MDKKGLYINHLLIRKRGRADEHRVISLRIKQSTLDKLEPIIMETEQSRNALLNLMILYALDQYSGLAVGASHD